MRPEIFLPGDDEMGPPPSQEVNNKGIAKETRGQHPTEQFISLSRYLSSIFLMPRSLKILALTHLISWMSHITYSLYFTDFVGEVIFNGDPKVKSELDVLSFVFLSIFSG